MELLDMRTLFFFLAAGMLLVMLTSGCTDRPEASNATEPLSNESGTDLVGIANPASTYCAEHGGEFMHIDTPDGEVGYCVLPGNLTCEEWTYFKNGTCVPPA
jgi:putative hemolysin